MPIPTSRIRLANDRNPQPEGGYVLYWMVAYRRPIWNFALQHAVDRAVQYGKPLLIFEPLRVRYRWASDRLHRFVIEGMRENAAAFTDQSVTYFPYVEAKPGNGSPLLRQLASQACVVVSDDYPCFFIPKMHATVAPHLPVTLELVDSNGIFPLSAADRTFTVAHSYRRWMQKNLLRFLEDAPMENPLQNLKLPRLQQLPQPIRRRWSPAKLNELLDQDGLKRLPINHSVTPATVRGGHRTANSRWQTFLGQRVKHYDNDRNHPDLDATSGLSPYLHFGHISSHQMVAQLLQQENWNVDRLGEANGRNHGFWNTSVAAEGFLDQLLTWREMGFNMTSRHPETYDRYESLPAWARESLEEHASDPRPQKFELDELENAATPDPIWNAAQRQLVRDGVMHNYMRMLWGKKILQWTASPQAALKVLIELNNKYAVDGRDPNSYSGIFWTLGRYDRAWGPERPIFGKVRYMTSESAKRKLRLQHYLKRYGAAES